MRLGLLIACSVLSVTPCAGDDPVPTPSELRTLAADRLEIAYSVPCLDRSAGDRFLSVDIAEVINPRSVELAFQVHYRRSGAERVYLGSFALFPPDRPGRFIVPTQGQVRQDGQIVISMEPVQETEAVEPVRVQVREVKLTDSGSSRLIE